MYKNAEKDVFGAGEPIEIVHQIPKLLTGGKVLVVGCGMGRHSIYLAQQGFQVTAIDFSEEGIEKLQKRAATEQFSISSSVEDLETWKPTEYFDAVVVSYVFHQIPKQAFTTLLSALQHHTNTDGIHAIAAFTKDGAFFRENPEADSWYANAGELKFLYKNWEIISYEEQEGASYKKSPDGKPYKNTTAFVLARKLG